MEPQIPKIPGIPVSCEDKQMEIQKRLKSAEAQKTMRLLESAAGMTSFDSFSLVKNQIITQIANNSKK